MHKKKSISFISALVALVLLGAGCAVMTVDVDVYKGPLANTEQTQGDQAISLSMGAKPLLVQLRDQLEVSEPPYPVLTKGHGPDNPDQYASDLEYRLSKFRTNAWYKADYIQVGTDPSSTVAHVFKNEFAVSVNDILSLYDDQMPSELADPITRIQQLADQYGKYVSKLRPGNVGPASNLWATINTQFTKNSNTNLIAAYKNFFYRNGPFDFQRGIFSTSSTNLVGTNVSVDPSSANAQFQLLVNGRAEADAEKLFGNTNTPEKQDFIDYVKGISQAFIDARTTMDQLFRRTVLIEQLLQQEYSSDPVMLKKVQIAVADLAAQLVNVRQLADGLTNNFITNFNTSIYSWPSNNIMNALQSELNHEPYNLQASDIPQTTNYPPSQWAIIESSFRKVLEQDDGTILEELLKINDCLENDHDEKDMFGLLKGPTTPGGDFALEITQQAEYLKSAAGNSLSGGRPAKGLQTLVEDYLKQNTRYRTTEVWPTDEPFQDLLDGLTEFAEKVVTLGNSAKLLDGSDESEVQDYVTVLQSVGNSLTVQIDELKARADHDQDLQKRSKLVGDAISQSAGFTNADLNNWPPSGSSADGAGVNYDAKDAAQQLETVLQMEYLKALHEQALSSGTNGNNAGLKPKIGVLAGGTNIVLQFSMSVDGMVTNAEITSPSFGQSADKTGVANSGGSNVILQISGPSPTAQIEQLSLEQPANPKTEAGTNLLLKLEVSSEGILTNANMAISPATISTNADLAKANSAISGLKFEAMLTLSSEALITAVTVTNMDPTNALTGMPPIHISLEVDGRMETNSPVASSTNNPTDKWLAVLQQATEFRAGMIYLRPASSYLRSSYAASTLQADEGTVWENMLQEQMFRGVPLLGGLNTDPNAATLSEIDKESWQNINRVRVAGIFKVNYAIVKDDIGNWYIKSFSSDPTNVFSSMAGLATYAAGGPLSGLAKGGITEVTSATTTTAKGASMSTTTTPTVAKSASAPIEAPATNMPAIAFTLITSNYLAQTIGTFTNLAKAAMSLDSQVIGSWPSLTDTNSLQYTNVLFSTETAAFSTLSNAIANAASTMKNVIIIQASETNGIYYMTMASAYDQQTINILSSVEDYAKTFVLKIDRQYSWNSRGTVITNTTTVVNSLLTDYINQRQNTLNGCESGLNLISQTFYGR